MFATIGKQFTFHAAHQLPNHDGQCRNLHGHTYTLEVQLSGRVKQQNGDPDEGMVLDFGKVKEVYKSEIEPLVEHKFLNDSLAGIVDLTTCEIMAAWMAHVFTKALPEQIVSVRLWETPTSWAEVIGA